MVSWSHADLMNYEAKQVNQPESSGGGVDREMDLHAQIMRFCDEQWPKWKYIRARSDAKSTIQVGASDFTIFMPKGKLLCIECKTAKGKLSSEQIGWQMEMAKLGHTVWLVRSMKEFMQLINDQKEGL